MSQSTTPSSSVHPYALPAGSVLALSSQAAFRLLEGDNGDAALLYLHLLCHPNTLPKQWNEARLHHAKSALADYGMLPTQIAEQPAAPLLPEDNSPPEYTMGDVHMTMTQEGGQFPFLVKQVELALGAPLNTNDLKILLTLHDHLSLPIEVILLLVSWCVDETERKYGVGKRPKLSTIRKEGFVWARLDILTLDRADDHIQKRMLYNTRETKILQLFQLKPRPLVTKEREYVTAWDTMGFGDDVLVLAYETTVSSLGNFKWAYCNGILKKWHEKNLHTLAEIKAGDSQFVKTAPLQSAVRQNGPTADPTLTGSKSTPPPQAHAQKVAEDGARLQDILNSFTQEGDK